MNVNVSPMDINSKGADQITANNHIITNDVFALSQHNAPFKSETKRMKRILDAKYSKADIKTIAESSTHLDPQERNEQYPLLKKYECLFDGNLGTWHGKPYDIKLKSDAEPYHGNILLLHTYMNSCSNKNSIDSSILRS